MLMLPPLWLLAIHVIMHSLFYVNASSFMLVCDARLLAIHVIMHSFMLACDTYEIPCMHNYTDYERGETKS